MDWGFYIYSYIIFFSSWMIKLYLVTYFSCDNMTYRLGGRAGNEPSRAEL